MKRGKGSSQRLLQVTIGQSGHAPLSALVYLPAIWVLTPSNDNYVLANVPWIKWRLLRRFKKQLCTFINSRSYFCCRKQLRDFFYSFVSEWHFLNHNLLILKNEKIHFPLLLGFPCDNTAHEWAREDVGSHWQMLACYTHVTQARQPQLRWTSVSVYIPNRENECAATCFTRWVILSLGREASHVTLSFEIEI